MASAQMEQLISAYQAHFLTGNGFDTIVKARQFAEPLLGQKIERATLITKTVDEAIESALVRTARQIATDTSDRMATYDRLVELYQQQPTLSVRTSDSILRQAYSTPIPIAYLAASLAGIEANTRVYEPTAGNGALLLLAKPENAIVNEINDQRAAELREQGFKVSQDNALIMNPQMAPVDVVICNPPFSSVEENGQTQRFQHGRLNTTQIDHIIALRALEHLKVDGRAVLLLGGKFGNEEMRSRSYHSQLTRGFYQWLYRDSGFNVTDHFTIAGSLYRKQGAGFPIDVIVIKGRGATSLSLPAVKLPRIYSSYEDLRPILQEAIQSYGNNHQLQPISPGTGLESRSPSILRHDIAAVVSGGNADRDNQQQAGISVTPLPSAELLSRRRNERVGSRSAGSTELRDRDDPSRNRPPRYSQSRLDGVGFSRGDRRSITSNPDPPAQLLSPGDAILPDFGSTTGGATNHTRSILPIPSRVADASQLNHSEGGGSLTSYQPLQPVMSEAQISEQAQEQQNPELGNQVPYSPRSKGFSLGTLTPSVAMKQLEVVFDRIEAATGMSVDEYVMDRLREPSQESMFKHYAAEQIDSLALAIYNYEYESKATLVGHDTGVGKTRIDCGLMRYANHQGLIPVVVTADPILFKDLLGRDAVDTGNSFHPLLTGNNWKIEITNELGEEIDRIATPANHSKTINDLATQGSIGGHDCVLTTYAQLSGKHSVTRRELLESIAGKTFLILDESHKAGGPAGEAQNQTRAQMERETRERAAGTYVGSCTEFFQRLVTKTPGFVALSATAIKDPIVASRLFYETTDLKHAAESKESFVSHVKSGGAPLQQYLFGLWTQSGGCIRCEKSYEGIEFGINPVEVNLSRAEENVKILKLINDFDRFKNRSLGEFEADLKEYGEKLLPPGTEISDGGVQSTNFTSVLHNLQAVSSLALKAEQTAKEVVEAIENGQKPVIMLFNTVESAIDQFIDAHNEAAIDQNFITDDPEEQLKPIQRGDSIALDAGHLFMRYLEKSREIRIQAAYTDEEGRSVTIRRSLTDEELGETGVMLYEKAKTAIEKADWSGMPVSPIDYMKSIIQEAGYRVGEITGRTRTLEYGSQADLQAGVVTLNARTSSASQKLQVMNDFQNGRCDAIITNSTTGYSLHASKSVSDQRQRVMFLLQPHLDINQVEQSIGRTHRSGQVNPESDKPDTIDDNGNLQYGQFPGKFGLPVFKLVVGKDLPTEERPVAVLSAKMRYLKANTTGNASSSLQIGSGADFLNKYGAEVAYRMVATDPKLDRDLGQPLGDIADPENGYAMPTVQALKKITGRVVMLASDAKPTPEIPYPSLKRQADFYDTLNSDYQDLLAQKIAMGENALEAQKLDIKAEPISRTLLAENDASIDSPFAASAYLVEVTAETGAKPLTTLQVVNAVRNSLDQEAIASLEDFDEMEDSYLRREGVEKSMRDLAKLEQDVAAFKEHHFKERTEKTTVAQGRVAKWQQRLFETENEKQAVQDDLDNLSSTSALETLSKEQERAQAQLQGKLVSLNNKIATLTVSLEKAAKELKKQEGVTASDLKNLDASVQKTAQTIEQYPIGQPVLLTNNDTGVQMYGVVSNVSHRSTYNPASQEAWKLSIKVVDGSRQLNLKFSEIGNGTNRTTVDPIEVAPSYRDPSDQISVYNLFDERQTQARETRYLVAGQVMKSRLAGKFSQITDQDGDIHSVYLLPRSFDPENLNAQTVPLKTSAQVKAFFEQTAKGGIVKTFDDVLTIRASLSERTPGIELVAPRAGKGKTYFGDEQLTAVAGEFISATEGKKNVMLTVVPPEKVDQVLDRLLEWSTFLVAKNEAAIARRIMGIGEATWEDCRGQSITPDDFSRAVQEKQPVVRVRRSDEVAVDSMEQEQSVESATAPETEVQSNLNPLSWERMAKVDKNELFVAPPSAQVMGKAEKNIARFLHDSGLAQHLIADDEFYLKVENEPYVPLVIERQGDEVYFTHYFKDAADELYIDSEMVLQIVEQPNSNAVLLQLSQTAVFMMHEHRSYGNDADKNYAAMFSGNLIAQRFPAAATQAWLLQKRIELETAIETNLPELTVEYLEIPAGKHLEKMNADGVIDRIRNNVTLNVGDRPVEALPAIADAIKTPLKSYLPEVRVLEVVNEQQESFKLRIAPVKGRSGKAVDVEKVEDGQERAIAADAMQSSDRLENWEEIARKTEGLGLSEAETDDLLAEASYEMKQQVEQNSGVASRTVETQPVEPAKEAQTIEFVVTPIFSPSDAYVISVPMGQHEPIPLPNVAEIQEAEATDTVEVSNLVALENAIFSEFPELTESLADIAPGDRFAQLIEDNIIQRSNDAKVFVINLSNAAVAIERSQADIDQSSESLLKLVIDCFPEAEALSFELDHFMTQYSIERGSEVTNTPENLVTLENVILSEFPELEESLADIAPGDRFAQLIEYEIIQRSNDAKEFIINLSNAAIDVERSEADIDQSNVNLIDLVTNCFPEVETLTFELEHSIIQYSIEREAEVTNAVEPIQPTIPRFERPIKMKHEAEVTDETQPTVEPESVQPTSPRFERPIKTKHESEVTDETQPTVEPIQSTKPRFAPPIRIQCEVDGTKPPEEITTPEEIDSRLTPDNPLLKTLQASAELLNTSVSGVIDSLMARIDAPPERHAEVLQKMGDRVDHVIAEQQISINQAVDVLLDEISSQRFIIEPQIQQGETEVGCRDSVQSSPKPSPGKPQIWQLIPDSIKELMGTAQIRHFFAQPDPIQAIADHKEKNPLFADTCDQLSQIYLDCKTSSATVQSNNGTAMGDSQRDGRAERAIKGLESPMLESPLNAVRDLIDRVDPPVARQTVQPGQTGYSPSLNELRKWYADAKAINQSETYLDQIKAIGMKMKALVPAAVVNPSVKSSDFRIPVTMQADMQRDAQAVISKQVEADARQILSMIQTTSYQGKTYGLDVDPQQNLLTITAAGRGVILQSENFQVKMSSLTAEDAATFGQHLRNLQDAVSQGRIVQGYAGR